MAGRDPGVRATTPRSETVSAPRTPVVSICWSLAEPLIIPNPGQIALRIQLGDFD